MQGKRRTNPAAALLLALVAVPLLWSLWQAVLAGLDAPAWKALWQERQTIAAWRMSLWSGLASFTVAVAVSAWLLSRITSARQLQALQQRQAWLLAVPHAAFAMGLVLWIAPSGWLLRALSPWATGLQAPPPWLSTQDPWGLGLIAVLVLKETPFLLWTASAHLLRPDVAQRLKREMQLAASLGYAPRSAWRCIVWPQLLPRMAAPLLAVLAYSLTVVDVALVIGPTSPPTLATLCWQWLQDASTLENAKGSAAAWALALTVSSCAGAVWAFLHAPIWRQRRTRGVAAQTQSARVRPRHATAHFANPGHIVLTLLPAVYLAVLAALLLSSLSGTWPFPAVLPTRWALAAWQTVSDSAPAVWNTLWLATASASCDLVWVVAWLECVPQRWHQRMQTLAYAPLFLPALLWTIGLHRLALSWNMEATASGVWLAHCLAALPYVMLTTVGAYSSFDPRYWHTVATLGKSRRSFLIRVKWPLLRSTLAAGFAVGFAVSVAQYLPTLYVGGGRISTVTTEAVTLAAGGQRGLMAAFAWLQWLLPMLVFAIAATLGRHRRFQQRAPSLGTIKA